MIEIKEQISKKLPSKTSLIVSFDYNEKALAIIKNCNPAIYDKSTKQWEVPINELAYLIDNLCVIDEIHFTCLDGKSDKKVIHKDKDFPLHLEDFHIKPFNYQIDGVQYGLNHDKFLLLDVPGLGKSLVASIIAKERQKKDGIQHCLIVCGINTLKFNWKNEIKKYTGEDAYILGEYTNKKGKLKIGTVAQRLEALKSPIEQFFVITNIETLRDDKIVEQIEKGKKNKFDMIVVDEVHTCKSVTSQQGKNLLKLKSAKYKIGMTGTLLLNNPLDCFLPLKWIDMEKANYTNYRYYFCRYGGVFNNELIGYQHIDELKDLLGECSIRRTKDLLDLPEKTIIDEYVDMNDNQSTFYENLVRGEVSQVDLVHISTASLLAMITRFRQATACPSILTSDDIKSSKIERACDIAEQIVSNNQKVVIFSTFKDTCDVIYDKLKDFGCVVCTGDTKDDIITKNIKDFQENPNCRVFIGTWQKCGTGITLTSANNMIFLDTPWTDGVYKQAQDRIHRIGSTSNVTIYNLICKDTIDERVHEIVSDKSAIADYIIDDVVTDKSRESLVKYIEGLNV